MRCGLVFMAVLVAIACDGGRVDDRELGNLVMAPPESRRPTDLAKIGDSAGLSHALTAGWDEYLAAGPGTLTVRVETTVQEGAATVETLTEDIALSWNAAGEFHAISNNSADYGREVLFVGGQLYLRHRYGRWHKRAPNDRAEPGQIWNTMGQGLRAAWELLAPGATLTKTDRTVVIGVAAKAKANPNEISPSKKWREARTIERAEGSLTFTDRGLAATGVLSGAVGFSRDGRRFTMAIKTQHTLTTTTTPWQLPAPDDVFATPTTSHEVDERDALLRGLAAPKAGTP